MKKLSILMLIIMLAGMFSFSVTAQSTTEPSVPTTTTTTVVNGGQQTDPEVALPQIPSAGDPSGSEDSDADAFEVRVLEIYDSLQTTDVNTGLNGLSLFTPVATANKQQLNQRFSILCAGMEMMGYGKTTTLEIPEFQTGYSSDLREKFTATYGNVSANYQTDMSLPEGMSMSSIMKDYTSIRDGLAVSAQSSPLFAETKNTISIGSIFAAANETKSMPSFKQAAQDLKSTVQSEINGNYNTFVTKHNERGKAQVSKYDSVRNVNYANSCDMFDTYVDVAKAYMEPQETLMSEIHQSWIDFNSDDE